MRVLVLDLRSAFFSKFHVPLMSAPSSFSCLKNWLCFVFSLQDVTWLLLLPFKFFLFAFTAASTSTTPDAFTISSHCPPLLFLTYYSTLFSLLWIYLSQTYETPSTYFSWHIKHFNITLKIWSTPFESFCPIPSTPLLSTLKVGGVGVSAF